MITENLITLFSFIQELAELYQAALDDTTYLQLFLI